MLLKAGIEVKFFYVCRLVSGIEVLSIPVDFRYLYERSTQISSITVVNYD